jgi:hypothetical protein
MIAILSGNSNATDDNKQPATKPSGDDFSAPDENDDLPF